MKSLLLIILCRLQALLPLAVLRFFGRLLAQSTWLLNSRTRKVTEDNIVACCPQLTAAEQQQLAKNSVINLGMVLMETGPAWLWPSTRLLNQIHKIEGLDLLQARANHSRGTIVLSPHIGNWEVLAIYLGANFDATMLYQPSSSEAMERLVTSSRCRAGGVLAPTNSSGVKQLLTTLNQGGMSLILPDQVPTLNSGEFSAFFQQPALTMTLVYKLLSRTDAEVIIAIMERDMVAGGFVLHFKPAPATIYAEDMAASLLALNQIVEACIACYPEQYQWAYKRFRQQPDNSRWSYRS